MSNGERRVIQNFTDVTIERFRSGRSHSKAVRIVEIKGIAHRPVNLNSLLQEIADFQPRPKGKLPRRVLPG